MRARESLNERGVGLSMGGEQEATSGEVAGVRGGQNGACDL